MILHNERLKLFINTIHFFLLKVEVLGNIVDQFQISFMLVASWCDMVLQYSDCRYLNLNNQMFHHAYPDRYQ